MKKLSRRKNRRQLKRRRQANQRRLMSEALEPRVVLTVNPILASFVPENGFNNPITNQDVNADAAVTGSDLLLVLAAMGTAEPGQMSVDAGEATEEGIGQHAWVDTNNDSRVSPSDVLSVASYLAEAEGGFDLAQEFGLFSTADPGVKTDLADTGTPLVQIPLNTNVLLTGNILDMRTSVPDAMKGVGNFYSDVSFEEGHGVSVVDRPDTPASALYDNDAFNYDFRFDGTLFGIDGRRGMVVPNKTAPTTLEEIGGLLAVNPLENPPDALRFTGPSFSLWDVQIQVGNVKATATDITTGTVQNQPTTIDVFPNVSVDDRFAVVGAQGQDGQSVNYEQTFTNGTSATMPGFGMADFQIVAANGDVILPELNSVQSVIDGGTATIDRNGTPTNPADDRIDFTPDLNRTAPVEFTYTIDAAGTIAMATITVEIGELNDPPVLTLPPSNPQVNEDTATAIAGVSVSDPDAGANTIDVALTVNNGGSIGVTAAGSANVVGGATTTISGSQTDVSSTLASLVYTPFATQTNAQDTITIVADDNGNSGDVGGIGTDTETLTIDINAVNDPPILSPSIMGATVINTATLAFNGGGNPTITLSDIDAGAAPIELQLSISTTEPQGPGMLSITPSGSASITGGANNSADVTLRGPQADLNASLTSLIYTPAAALIGTVNLDLDLDDLGNSPSVSMTDTEQIVLNVVPPRAPFAANDFISPDEKSSDNRIDAFLNDINGLGVVSVSGLSLSAFDMTTTMGGSVALVQPNADLVGAHFTYTPPTPLYNGDDTFTYTIDDTVNTPNEGAHTGTISISVQPINDPPTVSVPSPDSIAEGDDFNFSNAFLVGDVDVDPNVTPIRVTLTDVNGAFNPGAGAAATNVTNGVQLDGTVNQINASLAGTVYTPNLNYPGPTQLTTTFQIVADDLGNEGSPSALQTTATFDLTVTPVNDPPVLTVPGPQQFVKDQSDDLSGVSVADVDAANDDVTVTLDVVIVNDDNNVMDAGDLNVTNMGLTSLVGNGSDGVTLTGSVAAINNTLGSLTYSPATNFVGDVRVDVGADDNGNNGAVLNGQTDAESIAVEVLDFVPSDLGGKVWIDSNNDGVVQPDEFCIGGVDVTLTGMDIGNNAVNMTMTTDNDGNYQFAGLAPPLPGSSYRLAFDPSAETPFMLDGMDVIGTQGGVTGTNYFDISMPILGDVHGTGNNFALRGISPAYVSIWDILASQQGQLDQFGDVFYERLIVGVDGNGDEMFRINMGGWDNYSGIRVTNSDITGADVTGQLLNLSPTTRHVNRPLIRMMGELGVNGPRIYQIDGTGADTLSAAQPEGEGEASPEEALAIETMLAQLDSKASAEYADAVDAIFASDHTA